MPLAVNSTNGMRPVDMRCVEEALAHLVAGVYLQASAWGGRRRTCLQGFACNPVCREGGDAPACRVLLAGQREEEVRAHLLAGLSSQASAWGGRRRTCLQGFACKPVRAQGGDAPACRVFLAGQCVGRPATHWVAWFYVQASVRARRRRTGLQGFACRPVRREGGDALACRAFLASQRGTRFDHICGCPHFSTTTFVAVSPPLSSRCDYGGRGMKHTRHVGSHRFSVRYTTGGGVLLEWLRIRRAIFLHVCAVHHPCSPKLCASERQVAVPVMG